MNTTAKTDQTAKIAESWRRIAQEDLGVEAGGAMIYAIGSELAVLRLFHAYRNDPNAHDAAWSPARGAWVFTLQRRFDRLG